MSRLRTLSEPVWILLLGLLVFAAGLFISSGRFHSVDESAMFTAAHNLAAEGWPHTNQMGYSLWALRPGEAVNSLAPDGNLYTKKSPIMIVLLTPLIALAQFAGWETVRAALWLGPMLLAGTVVLFYSLARKLSYSRATATITTLIFAFATMALPYSQTIFGEELAMFGLMLALWSFVRIDRHPSPPPAMGRGLAPSPLKGKGWGEGAFTFLCGLGVALAIGVNAVNVTVAVLFGLFLLFRDWTNLKLVKTALWFSFPIVLLGMGLLAYNQIRFGSWLATGYNFAPGQEGFTTPLWWGLTGLLLSPARGLLWYSFPVILGLVGFPSFFKREKIVAWLILAVIVVQGVVFSLWWEWWGGYGWGPRFLLPIVPYLMLFALPFVEKGASASSVKTVQHRQMAQVVIIFVAFVGVLVQVAGVNVDANRYEQWLDANFPAPAASPLRYHHDSVLVYDVAASPIFNHWQQILAGAADDLAWLRPAAAPQMSEIAALVQSEQQPQDGLIFVAPELLYEVLDAELPSAYGLPYNIEPTDPLAQSLFKAAVGDVARLWLVTWYAPGDPTNWYEAQLRRDWASISDEWLGEYRLILLARPLATETFVASDAAFGEIGLIEYAVEQVDNILFITVFWTANATPLDDYVNFVQLLDENGRLLTQQDRPPQAGYKPTSRWQVGEVIKDQYAFQLDAETDDVQIYVGWYTWPDLVRLPVTAHEEHQVSENSLRLNP